MKEFEKWKKNEACSIAICNSSDCNDCDILRKQAWRAALEWVARRGMHYYGNDFLTDMNELSTEIQIELGMLDEHGKVIR